MHPALVTLRQDPNFWKLSPTSQINFAYKYLDQELAKTYPTWQAESPQRKDLLLRKLSLEAPTFNDEVYGDEMRNIGTRIYSGASGSELDKGLAEGWLAAMNASGIAGFVEKLVQGRQEPTIKEDRRRMLDYFKAVDTVSRRSDLAGEVGNLIGNVADIVGVNLIMYPLVAAAGAQIGIAAAGGAATIAAASAAGKVAPILHSALAFYGPIAAETLIEAVPYYLVGEQKAIQQGKPTIASQGALAVAKNFGVSAAADFVVGTVVTKVLGYAMRTMGKVFLNKTSKEMFSDAFTNETEFLKKLDQIEVGNMSPEAQVRMTKFDQADQFDRFMFNEYMHKGAADPDLYQLEGMGYWGVREGTKWLRNETKLADGTAKTTYDLFQFAKDGRPIARTFENFNDFKNSIAYRTFLRYSDMTPEGKTFFDTTGAAAVLKRGETLNHAMSILDADALFEADPILRAAKKGFAKAKTRPFVTRAEADALPDLVGGEGHVVKAMIPLEGKVIENINSHELDLLRGTGIARVAPSDTPNAVFVGVSEASQPAYDYATDAAKKIMERGGLSSLSEARASILLDHGYDYFRHPDGTTEYFTTRAMRLIGEPEDILLRLTKPTKPGSVASRVVMTEMGKGTATAAKAIKKSELTIDAAVNLFRKAPTVEDYNDFAKLYLAGRDVSMKFDLRRVKGDMPSFTINPKTGKWTLYVPSLSPISFDAEKRAATQLLTDLEAGVLASPGMSGAKGITYWASRIAKAPNKFRLPGVSDPSDWVVAATQKLGGKLTKINDTLTIELPSGTKHFTSVDDAVNFVARRTLDPTAMQNDLIRQGVRLTKAPDGTYIARTLREGKFMAGGSLDSVLDKIGYIPSSLDISYGARVINIDKDGLHFEFAGKPVIAKQEEMYQLLDTFKDQAFLNKSMNVLSNQKGIIDFTPASKYRVYLAKYKFEKEFDSLGEARRYLEVTSDPTSEIAHLDNLSEMARKKFLDFWKTPQGYTIVAPDTIHKVETLDEVADVFSRYPDLEKSVPSILAPLDPSIEHTVSQMADTFQGRIRMAGLNKFNLPPEFEQGNYRDPGVFMRVASTFDNMDTVMEQVAKKTGNDTVHSLYLDVEAGHMRSLTGHTEVCRTVNTACKLPNGKFASDESLRKIFYHMNGESIGDQYFERYKKNLPALTKEEEVIEGQLKRIMESLSVTFGIRADKMLFDYLPRLREFSESTEGKKLLEDSIVADDLVDAAWQGHPPAEIKAWFENERIDEVARFWVKDNVAEVMLLYSAQGHKKLYMNEPWKQLARYLKTPDGVALGEAVLKRIDVYRQNLMGSYHSDMELMIEDIGSTLFRKISESSFGQSSFGKRLGIAETRKMEEAGKDLLRSMLGLSYFSSMGWKPWLALRNTMQPLVTLAPRFGFDWTMRAWKSVIDMGPDYIAKLRKLGVISEQAPIVNQVFSMNTKLGRFAEKSMGWFKSGDDLTRAIAYRLGEMRFDNAYDALKIGTIASEAQFAELAGTEVLNPVTRKAVWDGLQEAASQPQMLNKARHEFANRIQVETQFSYTAAQQAPWTRGALGKFAGQYGAYSTGYRGNLYRMFEYAPIKKRAEMIASYLAITGALWATFDALKIRTNDFVPGMPSIFTFGPGLDIAVNAVKSMDAGYEGQIARKTLMDDLSRLAPGSAQVRFTTKALKYHDEGDDYRAILSLSSIPSIDE